MSKAEANASADFFDNTPPDDPQALLVADLLIRLNSETKICRKGKL